jgi:hypothetical protein
MGHNALTPAIRHAEGRDLAGPNVATLVDTPKGQAGRPSKSLTLDQASALLAAAQGTRMHAYVALCLATGIRTEEARALRWEHLSLGDPEREAAGASQRARVAVRPGSWRHQDREIAPDPGPPPHGHRRPPDHKQRQEQDRHTAGERWDDQDLVFATRTGAALDARQRPP